MNASYLQANCLRGWGGQQRMWRFVVKSLQCLLPVAVPGTVSFRWPSSLPVTVTSSLPSPNTRASCFWAALSYYQRPTDFPSNLPQLLNLLSGIIGIQSFYSENCSVNNSAMSPWATGKASRGNWVENSTWRPRHDANADGTFLFFSFWISETGVLRYQWNPRSHDANGQSWKGFDLRQGWLLYGNSL